VKNILVTGGAEYIGSNGRQIRHLLACTADCPSKNKRSDSGSSLQVLPEHPGAPLIQDADVWYFKAVAIDVNQ
jgi:hypothetical protein